MDNRRKGRIKLQSYFQKGQIPSQEDFEQLIDSMVNIFDDKVRRRRNDKGRNGYFSVGMGDAGELMAFCREIDDDPQAEWLIRFDEDKKGLSIGQRDAAQPSLFLKEGGNVGIGNSEPQHALQVTGTVGMTARVGLLAQGTLPADGSWHDILKGLDGYQALEVVAYAGKKGSHSIIHAIALNVFAGKRGTINLTRNCTGGCKYRLYLQWAGEARSCSLQVRSRGNYGGTRIHYYVTGLLPGVVNPALNNYAE